MAKTNYTFEKRQKELARKQKQEEKRLRKLASQDEQRLQGTELQEDVSRPPVDENTPG